MVTLSEPRGLIFQEGETWKTSRHVLSPTFSASKMKMVSRSTYFTANMHVSTPYILMIQMVPLVQSSADSLVKVFGEKAESRKSFEFFRYSNSIMIDTIHAV